MKSKYRYKKRIKKSKFDPYINEISEYLASGMSVRKIAEIIDVYFDDIVDESALYAFINSRGLRTKYHGGLGKNYKPPICDKCENCHEVLNTNGNTIRMCYYSRLVSRSCKTSPEWCPKRKKEERVS